MKKLLISLILVMCILSIGCKEDQITDFTVETAAMMAAYEIKDSFVWSETADAYYMGIMEGKMSLEAAKAVEDYFSKKYPRIIVNRFIRLASMVGFDLNAAGNIIGVDKVNIHLLQVAAQGFRMGLLLDGPVNGMYDDPSNEITLAPYGVITLKDIEEAVDITEYRQGKTLSKSAAYGYLDN